MTPEQKHDNSDLVVQQKEEIRPLISFCLLAYNQERFIREAVEGAFAQTYSPLEIILSDDCSTDRTYDIMREMVACYSGPHRVILNRNDVNRGLVGHLNFVLQERSRGLLVALAAGDDVSFPLRVEAVYVAWERTGRKAYSILSGYKKIDDQGGEVATIVLGRERFVEDTVCDYLRKMQPLYAPGCVQVFHRAVFELFGPLETKDVEDNNIAMRARILGEILLVNEVLVKYRVTGVVSSSTDEEYLQKIDNEYRIQTYKQVIRDCISPEGLIRLTPNEVDLIARIANAGIKLSSSRSFLVRLQGFLVISKYCPFLEAYHHAAKVHHTIKKLEFLIGCVHVSCKRMFKTM